MASILVVWLAGLVLSMIIGVTKGRAAEGFVFAPLGPFGFPMIVLLKCNPEV